MNAYVNGLITNEQVIQEMLELAKRIQEARQLGKDLGLSEEEMAFYDALTRPEAIKDFYRNDELIEMTRELIDALRRNRSGGGSFDAVMRAADHLRAAGADFNTLSVVHCGSEGRGAQIYRFLRDEVRSRHIQFLPVEGRQLSAAAYGRFLCDVFDVWSKGDIGKVFVQIFDATLARWCGAVPGLCTMGVSCGENLLVECNGDVYACDRFTTPEQRLGNLADTRLPDLYDDALCLHFRQAKTRMLPPRCRACEWLRICNGGCPAQRFPDGENRLCEGLKTYFRHVAPAMERMRLALLGNEPPV